MTLRIGRRARRLHALLLPLVVAACGAGDADAPSVVVRDSAGVQIVESPAALADTAYALALEAEPVFDIGVVEGAPEYQLFQVSSAQLLPDGRLVVANAGTQELRYFDAGGRYLSAVGRRGQGPGEYQMPALVPSPWPDTLLVHDAFARRLTVLSADGALVRTETLGGGPGSVVGALSSGRVVSTANSARAGLDSPEEVVTNEVVVLAAPPGSAEADTIGRFAGPDLLRWRWNDLVGFRQVPFDMSAKAGVHDDRVHVALGRTPEFHTYDEAGRLLRIVRIAHAPEAVTRAQFDAHVEEQVARASEENEKAEVRRQFGEIPMRDVLPAYMNVLVDRSGNLWAERYRLDPAGPPRWTVIDTAGVPRGTVALPAGVRILAVTDDLLVGTRRDDVDVEHVVAWRLVPAGS